MIRGLTFILLLATAPSFGQNYPATPQYSTFQPLVGGSNTTRSNAPQYQSPVPQVQVGATASDIRNNQANRAMYQTATQKQKEVAELMQQIQRDAANTSRRRYAPNPERTNDFHPALAYLQKMLKGDIPLSVADAYFAVEHAFGNPYLTKQQFDSLISQSADFIKTWMQQNGLSLQDNNMVHYAIKKFMAEPLTIQKTQSSNENNLQASTITHEPFRYDYKDYQAYDDHRNMFVTKCLATGFGQCASMPIVYLILAEKLGVKAYLSFAPQHSFIKHPDNSGYIINYEPTSGWEISDSWYRDNMHISAQAVKTGIYLDTLNSKQVVANCAFDLAVQYIRVDLTGNEEFILDCLHTGIPHFPENNNLQSLFIYSTHLKTVLREMMRKYKITNFEDLYKIPEAKAIYTEYIGNEAYITKLGYEDMPAGMYEAMLQEHEFKNNVQQELSVNGKEKRNLFIKPE
mgnify:CR=1 FL=1